MGSRVDSKRKKSKLIPVAEWAKKIGLSRSYVYRMGRLGMIQIKDGMIDPAAAEAALDRDSPTGGKESFYEARARKEAALASLRELELRIKQGEYLHAETAERFWSETISRCRSRLLAIPMRLAPIIVHCSTPAEAQAKIETVIHEALTELSQMDAEEITKETPK